jgi:hypothetical protein
MSQLDLDCLVLGNPPSVITVKILDNEKVTALKESIKEKKRNDFQSVDADTLDLWKVSDFDYSTSLRQLSTTQGFHSHRTSLAESNTRRPQLGF